MIFKQAKTGNYKPGRTTAIKYIVIHFTANNGDTARENLNYFSNNKVYASAHYFVDNEEVVQSVKTCDTAYHCGANVYKDNNCRNHNSIGVEMCSRKDRAGNYYIPAATVARTINFVRVLMNLYNVSIDHVLRHYDVTGKNCPEPFVQHPEQWQQFRSMLQEVDEMEKQQKINLNGKVKTVTAIEKNGYNYIKLQDLRDSKIDIDYCDMPIITVK